MPKNLIRKMQSLTAKTALALLFGMTFLIVLLGRLRPRTVRRPIRRLALVGTFHNPGWYLSHIRPLAGAGLEELVVVTDRPTPYVSGVRVIVPPPGARRWLGRASSKLLWLLAAAWRCRAEMIMGYNLMPGGCSALIVAAVLGRLAGYQMTGGPVEIVGGGFGKAGPLSRHIAGASPLLERLALAVVRRFDLVVVRGRSARTFLRRYGLNGSVAIITGSIAAAPPAAARRDIDLIYVGRLAPVKRPERFVDLVAAVRRCRPAIRAAVVGDGELSRRVREHATQQGMADCIEFMGQREDVMPLLARSKVFALTSSSEGLSIAMAEAMLAGCVPVVSNVGDLGDLVKDGVNGFLVGPADLPGQADRVLAVLADDALRGRLSLAAVQAAEANCGLDEVTSRWRGCWA